MSERIHALAQQLLGKSTIEECSVEELQHLTKRYPYFAPAQFLLLQKLKSEGSEEYEKLQQKAVLYYHDPLQFNYFISSDNFYTGDEVEYGSSAAGIEQGVAETTTEEPDGLLTEKQTIGEESAFLQTGSIEPETINSPVAEENDFVQEESHHPAVAVADNVISGTGEATMQAGALFHDEKNATEIITDPAHAETVPLEEINKSSAEEVFPENSHEEHQSIADVNQKPDELPVPENKTVGEENLSPENKPVGTQPADNGEALAFEPFHTVDYFASQGIKITAEELPKDKLSKQLRSFTEWLKTMKRLPAAEMAASPHSTDEKRVENMASHSVEESEVVTEAMAEVWAKQGAREKAIQTYQKLSLLNPSKNAYFAARIENLKGS